MSHGLELEASRGVVAAPRAGALAAATRGMAWLNEALLRLSMLALVGAAVILTGSVVTRYVFKVPTDWQDEASVFLIVAATFLCAGHVQSHRGHVGIAALASILPAPVNRLRALVADAVSLAFCAFFSWKSWTLLREAVAEHQTSSSTWAPPMWIPYSVMAAGMTLLSLQLVLQLLTHVVAREGERA